jgi:transposase
MMTKAYWYIKQCTVCFTFLLNFFHIIFFSHFFTKMLTNEEIEIASRMNEHEISVSVIASVLQKNYHQIYMALRRKRENIEIGEEPKINKSAFNDIIRREINSIMDANRQTPYRCLPALLASRLPKETSIPSESTCYRIVRELGYVNRKAVKKQFISTKNQQKRLEFSIEFLKKEDWFFDTIIWSDETMVRKMPNGKELYYWTRKGQENELAMVNQQLQGGGFGVMFWGCFSKFGLGPLVVVEGSMDREQYVDMVREYLLPQLEDIRRDFGVEMTFMQDNAPCHKARSVTNFFTENGVNLLPWPAQSPDLNPIENLWSIVKKRRQKKFGIPRTKNELIEQVFEIWEELDDELIDTLADSAVRRLLQCIEAKGRHTKY